MARLPEERRTATLLAFIHTLEASAADDVIDVFDAVSTAMFSEAEAAAKQARLGSLRDFDDAALKLRDMGIVVFDDATPDDQLRATIFELLGRDALLAAVERVGMLVEPQDETYFKELRKFHRKIRYVPALLAGLELDAAPADRPLLDAVEYLRAVHAGVKRPGPLPTAFAPADWLAQIKTGEGSIDLTGYRLCVLDGLRRGLRRRDIFPVRSIRYADPRKGLLTGAAWETARPMICRTVGVSASAEEELAGLTRRLDLAYRETAARMPTNAAVEIVGVGEKVDLSVEALDKVDEPASLTPCGRPWTLACPRWTCLNSYSKCTPGRTSRPTSPMQARAPQERRISRRLFALCCLPRPPIRASNPWFEAMSRPFAAPG